MEILILFIPGSMSKAEFSCGHPSYLVSCLIESSSGPLLIVKSLLATPM